MNEIIDRTGYKIDKEAKDWLDKGNNEKAIQSFKNSQAAHLKTLNYYRYFVATQGLSIVLQDTGEGKEAERIMELKYQLNDICRIIFISRLAIPFTNRSIPPWMEWKWS